MSSGKILQIIGPVVDVEFPENAPLPAILHALEVRNEKSRLVLEVAKHLGSGKVRAVSLGPTDGLRRDTVVYLSLLGNPERPRTLRFDGPAAKYMRPDERSLATVIKKALAIELGRAGEFVPVREGIAIADGSVACVWRELAGAALFLLEEGAPDLRECSIPSGDVAFVIGDHLGLTAELREDLIARGAQTVSGGPVSLHAEDVVTLVANELDRREASNAAPP